MSRGFKMKHEEMIEIKQTTLPYNEINTLSGGTKITQ